MVPQFPASSRPYLIQDPDLRPGILVSVELTDTGDKLWVSADTLAALPCAVNHDLTLQFWADDGYEVSGANYAAMFRFLSGDFDEIRRPYSLAAIKTDCFLYRYGGDKQWPQLRKTAGERIRQYYDDVLDTSIFDDLLVDATKDNDRVMYAFAMEKLGFPRHILPTRLLLQPHISRL